MPRKKMLGVVSSVFLATSFSAPADSAILAAAPSALGRIAVVSVKNISFWAEPYPFGYVRRKNSCISIYAPRNIFGHRLASGLGLPLTGQFPPSRQTSSTSDRYLDRRLT